MFGKNKNPSVLEGALPPEEKSGADGDAVFQIQRVYLKEASLEQPNSPEIFLEQEKANVEIDVGVEAHSLSDGQFYEVTVSSTVHTKIGEKTVFVCKCKQSGIFELRNIDKNKLGPVVGVVCPQIIYPYLRANVSDLVVRGGFPPVYMKEINFQAMYEAQQKQAPAASA